MYVIIYMSFIHQKRIPYLIRIAEEIPKDPLLGLLMMIFSHFINLITHQLTKQHMLIKQIQTEVSC